MAYKKTIIERACSWDGVNGQHFDTIKYIEVIFYNKPDKDTKPYFNYGAVGAVIGGSCIDLAISSINGTLKKGQQKVTMEEINKEVEKMKEEINKDDNIHKWVIPEYPDY